MALLAAAAVAGPQDVVKGRDSMSGNLRQLREEWGSLGLSEAGGRHLWETVRGFEGRRENREARGMACPVD